MGEQFLRLGMGQVAIFVCLPGEKKVFSTSKLPGHPRPRQQLLVLGAGQCRGDTLWGASITRCSKMFEVPVLASLQYASV